MAQKCQGLGQKKTEWYAFGLEKSLAFDIVVHRTKRCTLNILELFQSFQTDEQAIDHLEKARWHGHPICPYCKSENVGRHASGDRHNQRWQCRDCTRAFAVTIGTILHGTHMPLRKWFLLIALMLNAKKSASAYQISRDLGIRRATVWSMMHRVRLAMATDQAQADLLHGVVEADEVYIGGKSRARATSAMVTGQTSVVAELRRFLSSVQ